MRQGIDLAQTAHTWQLEVEKQQTSTDLRRRGGRRI
jgi:hypothetical protein